MDIYDAWNNALSNTEIIRSRVQGLMTTQDTSVPYILLSESSINVGDTVVRKGEVVVQKPQLILPSNNPQFEGFEFDEEVQNKENDFINFLIVRGISIPSLRYNNKTNALDVYEGKLTQAVKYYKELLQQKENVSTGLVVGTEEFWQFSLLIFICSQVTKNAGTDIRRLLEEYRHKKDK